jgi:hypothetical protein
MLNLSSESRQMEQLLLGMGQAMGRRSPPDPGQPR